MTRQAALRLGKAGERLRSEIGQIEQPADLPAGRFADDQRVRHGERLQPGGEVRGLADDPALLCGTLADQVADHGEPGGDAEPHAQILPRRQSADRLDHRQPGAHRPLGIVLMRLRIAEVDQHPVAHIFGDKPVEPADRIGDGAVVGADQLAQILRVEPRRECRRADQIAEHHRQLAAFGRGRMRRPHGRCIRRRGVSRQGAAAPPAEPGAGADRRAAGRTEDRRRCATHLAKPVAFGNVCLTARAFHTVPKLSAGVSIAHNAFALAGRLPVSWTKSERARSARSRSGCHRTRGTDDVNAITRRALILDYACWRRDPGQGPRTGCWFRGRRFG